MGSVRHSCAVHKPEFKFLARQFGYTWGFLGLFGDVRWCREDAEVIIRKWANRYQLTPYLVDIHFFPRNISITGNDPIVPAMVLRTIQRPASGLPPSIPDKPLPEPFEGLLRR